MGPKILTVDDSKTIRLIVARAFKSFACEIFEAADGVEGLTAAQREKPDIIILDLTMPIMDGVEMLTKLKADPELRSIPVVMLTAESGRENVLRIAKLGVRDYLIKPFKEELIVERVGRIIDLKAKSEIIARAKRFDDPLQVLVVDDKPAIIEQVQTALSGTPWKVQGAAQPGQAVDSCTQALPDIALVSLSLPEGAGFILFQMLRANVRTKGIPIVALSVKNASDEQTRAQQLGFNGVVTKPIDFDDVQLKITRALNLDTSHKYFDFRDGVLVLMLPANFSQAVANDITVHLRHKVCEAVDSGTNRVVIDMSPLKSADVTLIKLGISVIQLCVELDIRYNMIGSEAVSSECKNYEETKDWQFTSSFAEALAALNGKTLSMA
jgi:two-component system, cell cycle response regulator